RCLHGRCQTGLPWRHATVMTRASATNCGLPSPLLIVRGVVSGFQISRLPPVAASNRPMCVTVPQLAVGSGNVMAVLLEVCPPLPLLGLPLPPCVARKLASPTPAETRAYPAAATSVPPPASDGAAVNKATNRPDGFANVPVRKMWSMSLFSRYPPAADTTSFLLAF